VSKKRTLRRRATKPRTAPRQDGGLPARIQRESGFPVAHTIPATWVGPTPALSSGNMAAFLPDGIATDHDRAYRRVRELNKFMQRLNTVSVTVPDVVAQAIRLLGLDVRGGINLTAFEADVIRVFSALTIHASRELEAATFDEQNKKVELNQVLAKGEEDARREKDSPAHQEPDPHGPQFE
jgi:hypothetical protein